MQFSAFLCISLNFSRISLHFSDFLTHFFAFLCISLHFSRQHCSLIIHYYSILSLLSILFTIIHYYHYYRCYSLLSLLSLLFTIIIVRSVPSSYGRHFLSWQPPRSRWMWKSAVTTSVRTGMVSVHKGSVGSKVRSAVNNINSTPVCDVMHHTDTQVLLFTTFLGTEWQIRLNSSPKMS